MAQWLRPLTGQAWRPECGSQHLPKNLDKIWRPVPGPSSAMAGRQENPWGLLGCHSSSSVSEAGRAGNDGTGHVTSFPGLSEHAQAMNLTSLSWGWRGRGGGRGEIKTVPQLCGSLNTRVALLWFLFVCLVHTHKSKSDIILSSTSSWGLKLNQRRKEGELGGGGGERQKERVEDSWTSQIWYMQPQSSHEMTFSVLVAKGS